MRTPILLALILAACGSVNASDPRYEPATAAELSELVERIEALETKVTALEAENASLRTDLDAVKVASGVADYWLYDGNGVKKWKVGAAPDKHGMVEVEPGTWAHYWADSKYLPSTVGYNYSALYFSGTGCTGNRYVQDLTFNRLYVYNNEFSFVVTEEMDLVTTTVASQESAGTCYNITPKSMTGYQIAVTRPAAPFVLAGPLSVRAE